MLSIENYLEIAKLYGHEVYNEELHAPYNLNIVGVRKHSSRIDYFDDTINLYYQKSKGVWEHKEYKATTLPGLPSLLKPKNPKGTAVLSRGQYKDCYQLGVHKGKYPALVQVKDVKVYRDNNRNSAIDRDTFTLEQGLFGINIHKASLGAKLIGPNSEGCQVIQSSYDYEDFMYHINKSLNYRENKFTYTLVEI